ncbi:hypothetical protein TanjilG_27566 [Lupinus angustifolius]|uniref:Uncharacterized protein n=1 Tax=Lupinus angustifolius TaxID=3871 RepID=A0A4P1R351_LUPAN|nr:hypothetical protein TanjilG_27566 [Lupinus angustifolius]
MSKFPTMFSMRHFLVVSLALNVSLILRIVYDNEDNPSKYMGLKKTTTSEYDAKSRREVPIIHHLRLSTSTLANSSTCSDHPEDRDRIVNLDQ